MRGGDVFEAVDGEDRGAEGAGGGAGSWGLGEDVFVLEECGKRLGREWVLRIEVVLGMGICAGV